MKSFNHLNQIEVGQCQSAAIQLALSILTTHLLEGRQDKDEIYKKLISTAIEASRNILHADITNPPALEEYRDLLADLSSSIFINVQGAPSEAPPEPAPEEASTAKPPSAPSASKDAEKPQALAQEDGLDSRESS